MPQKMRKSSPVAEDTLKQLETLLLKVNINDCVIVLGDLNCKLGRNIEKLTGKWCIHKNPNSEGKQLLDLMRRTKLTAISTCFQPRRRKSNAIYLAKDPQYKPSQIDYVLISSRWATSIRDCKVKWGIACQRWGRHYDHGLVSCLLKTRLKMKHKNTAALDFSMLRADAHTQQNFENNVCANISIRQYDRNDPTETLVNLQRTVSDAAAAVLPKRSSLTLRKRSVSNRTKELYQSRQDAFPNMNDQQRKAAAKAIFQSAREDYRGYVDNIITDMEAAEQSGNTREVTRLTKVLSGKTSSGATMPSKDLSGDPIVSSEQLLSAWNSFLTEKFAPPQADANRKLVATVSEEDHLTESELEECLKALKRG